jgi:hypothetical protein
MLVAATQIFDEPLYEDLLNLMDSNETLHQLEKQIVDFSYKESCVDWSKILTDNNDIEGNLFEQAQEIAREAKSKIILDANDRKYFHIR